MVEKRVQPAGIKVFGICFIVYAISSFISNLSELITLMTKALGASSTFSYLELLSSQLAQPSAFDWFISSFSVVFAITLFFTGLYAIRKNSACLKFLKFSAWGFILANLLVIVSNIFQITAGTATLAFLSSIAIAFSVFLVLFWIFAMRYFAEKY